MSYQRYKRTKAKPNGMSGMGDVSSTIVTVADVAANPYFPEMVCRIQQISDIDHGRPVGVCAETPSDPVNNQSWQRVLMGMKAFAYAQQNQWVYPAALAVLIGLPMWIGYELGRKP